MRQKVLELVESATSQVHPSLVQLRDVAKAVDAAIDLAERLYEGGNHNSELFRLRKALEGLFGHDCFDED